MRHALFGGFALVAAVAGGAHAQSSGRGSYAFTVPIVAASAENVREALDSCIAITASNWIDLAALRGRLGWKNLVTAADNRGKEPVAGVFRKPGNEALVLITGEDLHDKRCRVVARLSGSADYGPLADAVGHWLGEPQSRDGDRLAWRQGPSTIQMTSSGTPTEPNAEFTISSSQKRNKDKQ